MLSLPLLVVFPAVECQTDIVLLALFRSTAQKDHDLLAVFPKVHPVAWAEIDLALKNTGSNTLDVRKVPKSDAV